MAFRWFNIPRVTSLRSAEKHLCHPNFPVRTHNRCFLCGQSVSLWFQLFVSLLGLFHFSLKRVLCWLSLLARPFGHTLAECTGITNNASVLFPWVQRSWNCWMLWAALHQMRPGKYFHKCTKTLSFAHMSSADSSVNMNVNSSPLQHMLIVYRLTSC